MDRKRCPECGLVFRSGAGLAAHRRARHGDRAEWGPNRRALEATLRELRQSERIGPLDTALIQALRSQAAQIDRQLRGDGPTAHMWRTYRETLKDLTRTEDAGDSFEELLAEINSRAPMGHPPEA